MRTRDIMTSPVVTVTPGTPLKDVAGLLVGRAINAVPVVDAVASGARDGGRARRSRAPWPLIPGPAWRMLEARRALRAEKVEPWRKEANIAEPTAIGRTATRWSPATDATITVRVTESGSG